MNKLSYIESKDKYENIRLNTLGIAHDELPEIITNKNGKAILKSDISLRILDFKTYQNLKKWKEHGQRIANWDWEDVRKKYRSHPKRFELSIWHRDFFLCGASIGKPTFSKNKLRLDYIEASPTESPLQGAITDIVILSGSLYAKAIGATEIRIMRPVNEIVRNHYLSKGGFKYNEKENFCYKDI